MKYCTDSSKLPISASSFYRMLEHMNNTECCFITAFRSTNSVKENRRRNKQLYKAIKDSGLSFIKSYGGYVETLPDGTKQDVTEDTFCVINNRYSREDFIKLACHWCGEFYQESVLVTIPVEYDNRKHTGFSGKVHIIGRYYNAAGEVEMEFNNVNMRTVEEYFTNIHNKAFVLSAEQIHVITKNRNMNMSGRIAAHKEFWDKFRIG